MKKRLIHYDLLRIFAAYLIVMLHLSVQYIRQAPASFEAYTQWEYAIAFSAFSRIGVPIFIMLSGLFLLNPDKNISISAIFTKYLPKIVLLFIAWSFFYAFAEQDFYRQVWASDFHFQKCWHDMDQQLFWHSVLRGNYHMWYLYMLAGLYLITPFVRIIAAHATKRQFCYFMGLCILITFVTKFNDSLWKLKPLSETLDTLSLTFAFGYVGYFLAGYFLDKIFSDSASDLAVSQSTEAAALHDWKTFCQVIFNKLKQKLDKLNKYAILIYLLGAGAFFFTVAWTVHANPMFGFRFPELILFSNYSPTVFLMSFAVFTFTARLKHLQFPRFLRIIAKKLPKYMLLVYMIHPFFIVEARRGGLLLDSTSAFSLPFNAFIVFLISLVISIVLQQIYEGFRRISKWIIKYIR
ncbi:acyltransferase [Clostridium aminobutyricum]|uniref:Acyltransferase family protein n=1 Tax=Clostridium aminobutyricum TaxID=33953 RepID=A0A939D9W8_CLOAM|nr:acyltransferase family protein [Clostridium aminobutyricum]MBN7774084.1 acyltransferase family protein [Clostridium aminobutyricum]